MSKVDFSFRILNWFSFFFSFNIAVQLTTIVGLLKVISTVHTVNTHINVGPTHKEFFIESSIIYQYSSVVIFSHLPSFMPVKVFFKIAM